MGVAHCSFGYAFTRCLSSLAGLCLVCLGRQVATAPASATATAAAYALAYAADPAPAAASAPAPAPASAPTSVHHLPLYTKQCDCHAVHLAVSFSQSCCTLFHSLRVAATVSCHCNAKFDFGRRARTCWLPN